MYDSPSLWTPRIIKVVQFLTSINEFQWSAVTYIMFSVPESHSIKFITKQSNELVAYLKYCRHKKRYHFADYCEPSGNAI